MISAVFLLTFVFSVCNIVYMYLMQQGLYFDFYNEEQATYIIFLAYISWLLMSYAMKKFVIDDEDFSIKSVFTTAPLLGLVIYVCCNVVLLSVNSDWTPMLALYDTIFGVSMFMFVSLFALIFKPYIN